jgi:serine/threonine-protein kinase
VKACPTCARLFPNDAGFCSADGASLLPAEQVPVQAGDDPRLGSTVARRYHIRRVVADGGMGRVYEALDTQTDRRVALKMLHSDVANDTVAVARFKREFQVSSQLPHAHIIDVLDFQQEGGTYALVMEFLDGEELRTALQRDKTLSPGRVVRMVSQTAIGLDAAHASKFVHRDLKPDNIFLCGTREGDVVKILDFGSVKDKSENAKKLTMLGTTIGSPYYMAPEQAQGLDTLDHRADVWAVAAIVYESLLGTVPFPGNSGPTILLSIMTKDPVPPSEAGKKAGLQIPPTLDDVIEEAFVKNPAGRIPSVGELANRIGKALGLQGDFHQWAATPVDQLEAQISAALPSLMTQVSVQSAGVMADPFASPAMTMQSARSAMDDAFRQGTPPVEVLDTLPIKKGPPVALLVGIGALFLLLGGVAAFLLKD